MTLAPSLAAITPAVSVSASVSIGARDTRCRWWAKIIRKGTDLPMPASVQGANDLPGFYLRAGDEELFQGDVFFEGEQNHPRKTRGWDYWASIASPSGKVISLRYDADVKARMKALGLPVQYLAGSGQLAGLVRVAHALQTGVATYRELFMVKTDEEALAEQLARRLAASMPDETSAISSRARL